MENGVQVVNGYMQDQDGKWVLTPEAKAEATAMYYSGRLAYNREDSRIAIGRYSPTGEVIPFKRWTDNTTTDTQ